MNLKLKLVMLALAAGGVAMQLGACARIIGDLVGDSIFLRGID